MTATTQYLETAKLRYVEAAKIEQVVREFEARGYSVELEVAADDDPHAPRFDILAQRGADRVAVEVKVPGDTKSSADQMAWLRKLARAKGITEFQVVIAHPPQSVVAEVQGIEHSLAEYFRVHWPTQFQNILPNATIDIVHEVTISEIHVGQEGTFVTGDGLLRIILPAPGNMIGANSNGSHLRESFPFHFALTLDGSRRIVKADLAIDTSDWED